MNTTMARGLRPVRHSRQERRNLTLGFPPAATYSIEHTSNN